MEYNFLQILIAGFGVLIVAILANFIANYLGIETWYGFIELVQKNGFSRTIKEKWLHLPFLFFIYPSLLGLSAYYIFKFFN